MTINDYCKNWRINRRIRQSDIAKIAGISENAISEFERGNTVSGKIIVAYIVAGMEISHPNSIMIDK
jgi:transcriptional regulator with XRE-family HTH domain